MQPTQLHWTPRLGVWVDYSFLPDTPCTWEFSRNAIQVSLLTKNALVRTSEFPLERQQTCSVLVLVLYCRYVLYHDRNTVDWTWWRHKITAQRGPALRSCTGPRVQVLHWAPHLLGPALITAIIMSVRSLHTRLIHLSPSYGTIFLFVWNYSRMGTCLCKSIASKNIQSDMNYILKMLICSGQLEL